MKFVNKYVQHEPCKRRKESESFISADKPEVVQIWSLQNIDMTAGYISNLQESIHKVRTQFRRSKK